LKFLALVSLLVMSCDPDDRNPEGPSGEGPEMPTNPVESSSTPCENGMAGIYPCNGFDLIGRIPLATFEADAGNDSWGWTLYLGKLPTRTGSSTWRDIKVYKDHAFIVSEASDHGLQVFDLTKLRDVANAPVTFQVDATFSGFGNAHNIVINEDTGFAYAVGTSRGDAFGGGAHFIDIRDPKNPIAANGYAESGYTHDAQVVTYNGPDADYSGREIFIGANERQVVVADVTDKDNPTFVSSIFYNGLGYTHQGWFTEDQRYFLLGDETDELERGFKTRTLIFDMEDLDNPALHFEHLGVTSAIDHNGYVKGNEFYLSNYTAGVRIYDISSIANKSLTETAFFDTFPINDNAAFDGVWSVYPYFESGKIVVSDSNSGLFIIKKSQ